ncbi:hypothetical protein [Streptomyces gibsoniae]|uniref:Uncharacterized protein n=1 Tax=Streptomyces gibsoniae TaxID=3075529 RepID=A0ABU2UA03_9ACTN|nr:hypothetical protein [Streptomyces sp. DSM 41699]MDT0469900.1 hypothetical protein [Streptomyces sp. DSM 41699]
MLTTLGAKAPKKGYRVRHTPTTKLVNEPTETTEKKQLTKTIARPVPGPSPARAAERHGLHPQSHT